MRVCTLHLVAVQGRVLLIVAAQVRLLHINHSPGQGITCQSQPRSGYCSSVAAQVRGIVTAYVNALRIRVRELRTNHSPARSEIGAPCTTLVRVYIFHSTLSPG